MLELLVLKPNKLGGLYVLITAFLANPKSHQISHKLLEQWFSTLVAHRTTWEAVNHVSAGISPPEILVELVWVRPGHQDFSLLPCILLSTPILKCRSFLNYL